MPPCPSTFPHERDVHLTRESPGRRFHASRVTRTPPPRLATRLAWISCYPISANVALFLSQNYTGPNALRILEALLKATYETNEMCCMFKTEI